MCRFKINSSVYSLTSLYYTGFLFYLTSYPFPLSHFLTGYLLPRPASSRIPWVDLLLMWGPSATPAAALLPDLRNRPPAVSFCCSLAWGWTLNSPASRCRCGCCCRLRCPLRVPVPRALEYGDGLELPRHRSSVGIARFPALGLSRGTGLSEPGGSLGGLWFGGFQNGGRRRPSDAG